MILLDTDHASVLTNRQAAGHAGLRARMDAAVSEKGERFALPIVSAEEQCRGWLAEIGRRRDVRKQVWAYEQLGKLFEFLAAWKIVPLDGSAGDRFEQLRKQRVRIGTADLRIASIALVRDALLLSANLRDFRQVPELRVENWLEPAGQNL
jgi:tRNA(fMet)-specific endonuclease VapC